MPVEPKPPLGALIRAESIGIRLTATSHEASIATVIVIATLDRYSDMKLRSPNRLGMNRSEEHTSELQSLMRISYAVFCLKKQKNNQNINKSLKIMKNILETLVQN